MERFVSGRFKGEVWVLFKFGFVFWVFIFMVCVKNYLGFLVVNRILILGKDILYFIYVFFFFRLSVLFVILLVGINFFFLRVLMVRMFCMWGLSNFYKGWIEGRWC